MASARAQSPQLTVQSPRRKSVSLWRNAWRRLLKNKLAVTGGSAVLVLALVAIFADVLAPYHYTVVNFGRNYEFPSREFPLGTDHLGRDVLSRIMYGARVSMTVGFVAEFIVLCIGVPLGALAGYYGGKVDMVLMRCVDVMYAFPRLLFVILIMSMLGRGLLNIFIAIGLTGWVRVARLTRAQILSLKEREFCEAARAAGASHAGIIVRHLLPNALTPIIVSLTFGIPEAIFTEAALSFIGVGISPPTPSWGQMVGENQQFIRSYWYLCVFPAAGIASIMLAFTFLGDGLRDALDPRLNE
jgi:oligopeptide transport system permease protein